MKKIFKKFIIVVLLILFSFDFVFANDNLDLLLKNSEKFDIIKFGKYEQNNITKDDIDWLVLENDKKDKKVLLMSLFILDCERFNEKQIDITWEKSSIREFMNGYMYNTMFDNEEKKRVLLTDVVNNKNMYSNADSGNNTKDYLFLPSIEDMYKYFTDDTLSEEERKKELLDKNPLRLAVYTLRARKRGIGVLNNIYGISMTSNYLLRTMGLSGHRLWYNDVYADYFVSYVSENGAIMPGGTGVNSMDDGIRVMVTLKYE